MVSIKKAYYDAPHGQVHYRYAIGSHGGHIKTPIVFLHMACSSSGCFEALMGQFAALGHDCYAPDMPGFGYSDDEPEDTLSTTYYTNLFMALFSKVISSENFYVVGHHSGAVLGVEMANLYPKKVRGLFMIGPALLTVEERETFKSHTDSTFNYNKPVADGSHLMKTWNHLIESGVGTNMVTFQRDGLDHIRAWRGRNQAYAAVWNYDCIAGFQNVNCPVMAVCAKDDVLWPYFPRVQEAKPTTKVEEVTGANHTPDRDPEGAGKWLREFILSNDP